VMATTATTENHHSFKHKVARLPQGGPFSNKKITTKILPKMLRRERVNGQLQWRDSLLMTEIGQVLARDFHLPTNLSIQVSPAGPKRRGLFTCRHPPDVFTCPLLALGHRFAIKWLFLRLWRSLTAKLLSGGHGNGWRS
jgi:hypothetical protein